MILWYTQTTASIKCKHRRFCIIGHNRGREQKKGDKGECSDFNFHRLCHSDHCSVMRKARENPLSVPRECNPFHHPIRPLLLSGESRTRVQEELEDPRQVRNRDDKPPVIAVGRVAYRDLSKALTGDRRPRQTAGGWGATTQGAQPTAGWGAGTSTAPRTQNAGGWGAVSPSTPTNGWGAGTPATPNAQNTGGWGTLAPAGQLAGHGTGTPHAD